MLKLFHAHSLRIWTRKCASKSPILHRYRGLLKVPAGVGSKGRIHLNHDSMHGMLRGGAKRTLEQGFGVAQDLERIEEQGCMAGAEPRYVLSRARERQKDEMGTLGSGNHYLEVQRVAEIVDETVARVFGLKVDDVVISIHCGSRGLGHQIGTEFPKEMALSTAQFKINLPDGNWLARR